MVLDLKGIKNKFKNTSEGFQTNTDKSTSDLQYMSIAGVNATIIDTATGEFHVTAGSAATATDAPSRGSINAVVTARMKLGFQLPDGAEVFEFFGSGTAAMTFTYYRDQIKASGNEEVMGSHATNSGDTSIVNPVIDNATYYYFIEITSVAATDDLDAVRIAFWPRSPTLDKNIS